MDGWMDGWATAGTGWSLHTHSHAHGARGFTPNERAGLAGVGAMISGSIGEDLIVRSRDDGGLRSASRIMIMGTVGYANDQFAV